MPRRGQTGDPARMEVNMTPMLDVVLQLITFFMMLVHFGVQIEAAEVEVRLPVAPAALPGGVMADDRLVVAVGPDGALLVDGRALLGSSASEWWAAEARQRGGSETLDELPTRVIIRADRDASYGAIRLVLSTAQEHGFAFFTLVVLRSD
ncbi:hypothetical protein BH23PLA1_BH23PLA1_10790 [soil metagenome]